MWFLYDAVKTGIISIYNCTPKKAICGLFMMLLKLVLLVFITLHLRTARSASGRKGKSRITLHYVLPLNV